MNNQNETYEKVAKNCSRYDRAQGDCYKNSSCDSALVSCLNCTHFNNSHHCDLDLYDKIIKDHNF